MNASEPNHQHRHNDGVESDGYYTVTERYELTHGPFDTYVEAHEAADDGEVVYHSVELPYIPFTDERGEHTTARERSNSGGGDGA